MSAFNAFFFLSCQWFFSKVRAHSLQTATSIAEYKTQEMNHCPEDFTSRWCQPRHFYWKVVCREAYSQICLGKMLVNEGYASVGPKLDSNGSQVAEQKPSWIQRGTIRKPLSHKGPQNFCSIVSSKTLESVFVTFQRSLGWNCTLNRRTCCCVTQISWPASIMLKIKG